MNKSLLVASFAVLTASVFGMDSDKITENKRQFSLSPVNKEPDKKRMKSNNQDVRDFLRRVVKENFNLKEQLSEEKSRNDKNEKDNRRIMVFLRDISNEHTENISEISELKDQKENVENKNTELARIIQKKESDIKKVSKNLFVSELSKAKPNNKNRILQHQTNKLQKENEDLKKKLRESQNSNRQLETENQKLKRKKEDLENSLQIKNQTITEYQGELKSLESEIQELKAESQVKDEKIADITKQFENSQNNEKDLKRKLDDANQKVSNLKKQRTLKVFKGEVLNMIENPKMDLSKYGSFPNLKTLAIRLDKLPDILRNKPDLSKITYLDIYKEDEYFSATQLPNLFQLASNTETLNFFKCDLTSLPKEVGNLKNLRELKVDFNSLTSLPKEIGNLKKLKFLCLRGNQLNELPAEIYALPKLKELDIRNNPLNKLSKKDFVSSNIKIYQ